MNALHTLLHGIIDYAGLFPPANLTMEPAVSNYAAYRQGATAWALGRFIVPVARLDEFETAAAVWLPRDPEASPWRLSVLGSADLAADIDTIFAFNSRHAPGVERGAAVIDTLEVKAATAAAIAAAMDVLPRDLVPYFELPIAGDPRPLIAAVGRVGARAKVRTGGITQDAFPATPDLLRFIHACVEARVPFKATAGLHHPLRSIQRLTYAPDSASGLMYGFLNVFLTAGFLHAGINLDEAARVLEEADSAAFHFDDSGVGWRGYRLGRDELANVRQSVAISFGSCSFVEPIDDLKAINLL